MGASPPSLQERQANIAKYMKDLLSSSSPRNYSISAKSLFWDALTLAFIWIVFGIGEVFYIFVGIIAIENIARIGCMIKERRKRKRATHGEP